MPVSYGTCRVANSTHCQNAVITYEDAFFWKVRFACLYIVIVDLLQLLCLCF